MWNEVERVILQLDPQPLNLTAGLSYSSGMLSDFSQHLSTSLGINAKTNCRRFEGKSWPNEVLLCRHINLANQCNTPTLYVSIIKLYEFIWIQIVWTSYEFRHDNVETVQILRLFSAPIIRNSLGFFQYWYLPAFPHFINSLTNRLILFLVLPAALRQGRLYFQLTLEVPFHVFYSLINTLFV